MSIVDDASIVDSDAFQKGVDYFKKISQKAVNNSEELIKIITEQIIKDEEDKDGFNLTIALLSVSKTLSGLSSYLYDSEEEYLEVIQKARDIVTDEIIPTLLKSTPCGECEQCKNGHPDDCINPKVREDLTSTRFLPILCAIIIEYDFFNKIVYSHLEAASSDNEEDATEIVRDKDTDKEETK